MVTSQSPQRQRQNASPTISPEGPKLRGPGRTALQCPGTGRHRTHRKRANGLRRPLQRRKRGVLTSLAESPKHRPSGHNALRNSASERRKHRRTRTAYHTRTQQQLPLAARTSVLLPPMPWLALEEAARRCSEVLSARLYRRRRRENLRGRPRRASLFFRTWVRPPPRHQVALVLGQVVELVPLGHQRQHREDQTLVQALPSEQAALYRKSCSTRADQTVLRNRRVACSNRGRHRYVACHLQRLQPRPIGQ